MSEKRLKIFLSYRRVEEDIALKEKIHKHFKPIENTFNVEFWSDDSIVPGQLWYNEIMNALNSSTIIIYLVSADFFDSTFIKEEELPKIYDHARGKGVTVLWLLSRKYNIEYTDLSPILGLHDKNLALDSAENKDEFLSDVTDNLVRVINDIRSREKESTNEANQQAGTESFLKPVNNISNSIIKHLKNFDYKQQRSAFGQLARTNNEYSPYVIINGDKHGGQPWLCHEILLTLPPFRDLNIIEVPIDVGSLSPSHKHVIKEMKKSLSLHPDFDSIPVEIGIMAQKLRESLNQTSFCFVLYNIADWMMVEDELNFFVEDFLVKLRQKVQEIKPKNGNRFIVIMIESDGVDLSAYQQFSSTLENFIETGRPLLLPPISFIPEDINQWLEDALEIDSYIANKLAPYIDQQEHNHELINDCVNHKFFIKKICGLFQLECLTPNDSKWIIKAS